MKDICCAHNCSLIDKARSPRGVPFSGQTRDSIAVSGLAIPPDQKRSQRASTLDFSCGSVSMDCLRIIFDLLSIRPTEE